MLPSLEFFIQRKCSKNKNRGPHSLTREDVEIIEENAVVSVFSGSNWLKGGTGSFLTLGMIAMAMYFFRKKMQARASSALSAPTAYTVPTQPRHGLMNYPPSAPPAFNQQFLSPAIEMQPQSPPPPGPLSREQLTALLMAGVPPASNSTPPPASCD